MIYRRIQKTKKVQIFFDKNTKQRMYDTTYNEIYRKYHSFYDRRIMCTFVVLFYKNACNISKNWLDLKTICKFTRKSVERAYNILHAVLAGDLPNYPNWNSLSPKDLYLLDKILPALKEDNIKNEILQEVYFIYIAYHFERTDHLQQARESVSKTIFFAQCWIKINALSNPVFVLAVSGYANSLKSFF